MTPSFLGHERHMIHLKYLCDAHIRNGRLKSALIALQNNDCQSFCLRVIKNLIESCVPIKIVLKIRYYFIIGANIEPCTAQQNELGEIDRIARNLKDLLQLKYNQ